MTSKLKKILGIKFFTGEIGELIERCPGQFIVIPSAPSLVDLPVDPAYREAMEKSDFAITDSAYMLMIWKALTGETLTRISGLKFLRALVYGEALKRPGASFWIMPSTGEMDANLAWLNQNGFLLTRDNCYVAPLYPKGPLTDTTLRELIEARKPDYVIINIGGGVQERLGYYLKKELSFAPSIVCSGAAIAFMSGLQANIPVWADAYKLGWLLRCLQEPGKFIPRYYKAFRLAVILLKYRERSAGEPAIKYQSAQT